MAEPDDAPEGWGVRQRPALIAGLSLPVALLALLALAGRFYDRDLRPAHRQPVTAQPAPGLETYIHDGIEDPYRPLPAPSPTPAVERAKRAVVAEGLPGWAAQR